MAQRMLRKGAIMALLLASGTAVQAHGAQAAAAAQQRDITVLSLADLSQAIASGRVSSEAAVKAYLARIDALNHKGPKLNAVIAVEPGALAEARALDAERKAGKLRGPLHGVPILVKDNIETKGALPTTAGSLALADNRTGRDAPVIARLRAAGAVILGKTNLSEWANIRSSHAMSGWSAVGGLVRNPYALDRTACGSSSGSGAAIAAELAAGALGTETDGSVTCPSAINGLVGLKPTLGYVSRTHIVPISHSQDTAGPMARSVRDVAILFSGMVGSDPADPVTAEAGAHRQDFVKALDPASLKGVRVGYIEAEGNPAFKARFAEALAKLKAAGAVPVPVKEPELEGLGEAEMTVLMTELKADMNTYLASTPATVKSRTLADLIAFNKAHAAQEMPFFGQELFEEAEKTKGLDNPDYKAARAKSLQLAGVEGIDRMLAENRVKLIVTPTYAQAWLSDPVYGDQYDGPSASTLPAVSGYPHLTVPMGLADGLPVGLSFIGPKWSDAMLLGAGYAYEQQSHARVAPGFAAQAQVAAGLDPE